ncbi:hypothetical protein MMC25_002495 [Agyrium rufum]|nr:hypothetical protein [Agyrium rufum]
MSSPSPQCLTGDKEGIGAFIDKFDVFLFDCDGVLWSGDHVFEGTADALEKLRSRGKRIIFVTNNSTKSRKNYKQKLIKLGIPAEEPSNQSSPKTGEKNKQDEVFGSAYSAAIYISLILRPQPPKNKVFVLGESGIESELSSLSIPHLGGTSPLFARSMTPSDYVRLASGADLDPNVGVVLCGLDHDLNYLKLATAYHYIVQNGATFLATNMDSTLPSAGSLFPGAGSCTAPLVKMLGGREPLALGKPSQAMMDAVEGKFGFERARACMVGDRLDTDIRFGIEGGLGGTLAVLTGVSKREDWEAEGAVAKPAFWVEKLGDLREGL